MENGRKTEEQLTQEIMQRMTQLYEQFGNEPEKIKEAMQTEIASILASQGQKSSSKGDKPKRRFELSEKSKEAMLQAMEGKETKEIARDLGMSKSGVFLIMQREGIMTKTQVIDLIEVGKNNNEIHTEGRWTIEAIENIRKELIEKQEKRKAARRASDRKRKEKMKAERRPGIEAKQRIRKKREQDFREALALGLTTVEIAAQFGFKDISTVRVKKSKEGLLGRKEIIALLPNKSNEEIAAIARIENVSIIAKIRADSQNEAMQQNKATSRQEDISQSEDISKEKAKSSIPKQDEETFLKLAQSLTSVKKIAEQLGLTEEQVRDALYDYNIFTREEIIEWLDSKSNVQIAIMGNLDYTVVEKVRKEEERKLAKGERIPKPTTPEAQKKKEEKMFFRMARNYEPVEKMESVFQMDQYKIILKLRKLKLYSRAEVERMLEKGGTSDVQIAGENGNVNAVGRIRRKVQKREILIRSIPEEKRAEIRRKVSSGVAVSSIAYDTRVNISIIRAIQEKWKRDKALEISDDRKKVDFKRTWIDLKARVCTLEKSSSDYQKNNVQYMIEKILVEYEIFLTQSHYAYMAYVYMKMEKNEEGIEFAVEYLNLQSSSTKAVKDRIDEILKQEKERESPRATDNSQNMGTGWPDLDSI